jgi:hypothetical protein
VVRNVDELACFACGTLATPRRAWDAVEEPSPVRPRSTARRTGLRWTAQELEYLMRNKDRLSAREIARRLGRTERGVHTVLSKLRQRKARRLTQTVQMPTQENISRSRWSPAHLAALEDFARPGALRTLAARLRRSHSAVRSRLYRMRLLASEADGMLSLRQVAVEYRCPISRVRRLVLSGALAAQRVGSGTGTRYRVAPEDCEAIRATLTAIDQRGRGRRKVPPPAGALCTSVPREMSAQNADVFFPDEKPVRRS